MVPQDRLALSVNEFCAAFGIGRDTLYHELKAGRLKAAKIGTRTLIGRDEAARWFSARVADCPLNRTAA